MLYVFHCLILGKFEGSVRLKSSLLSQNALTVKKALNSLENPKAFNRRGNRIQAFQFNFPKADHSKLEEFFSRVILETIRVPDIPHYSLRIGMPRDFHYLVQTRMVNGGARYKSRPKRMSRHFFRIKPYKFRVALHKSRYIRMMHRSTPEPASAFHRLEKIPLGNSRCLHPIPESLYRLQVLAFRSSRFCSPSFVINGHIQRILLDQLRKIYGSHVKSSLLRKV